MFFIIRVVHDKQYANMEMQFFQENVLGIEVSVPCAVNFKDVNKEEEIVLYKPQVKIPKKTEAVAAVLEPRREREPATKKSKKA